MVIVQIVERVFISVMFLMTLVGLVSIVVREFKNSKSRGKTTRAKEVEAELKGKQGEQEVTLELNKLNKRYYKVLNDIYIPYGNSDKKAQCDHVVVSNFGIFVIETKNYSGKVVGDLSDEKLTQVLGKKEYEFYNPILQNEKHIDTLCKFLGVKKTDCISIVNFCNKTDISELKRTDKVVNTDKLLKVINKHSKEKFSTKQVNTMVTKLNKLPRSNKIKREHKKYVKRIHSK